MCCNEYTHTTRLPEPFLVPVYRSCCHVHHPRNPPWLTRCLGLMGVTPHSASFIAEASGTMYSSTVPRRVGAWQRGARGHEGTRGAGWAE